MCIRKPETDAGGGQENQEEDPERGQNRQEGESNDHDNLDAGRGEGIQPVSVNQHDVHPNSDTQRQNSGDNLQFFLFFTLSDSFYVEFVSIGIENK